MINIEWKKNAAEKAVEEIRSGMVIGLGTGSTAQYALELISVKLKSGELKNLVGIPTSERTKNEAVRFNIPLTTIEELRKKNQEEKVIDLTIDGADEVTIGHSDPDVSGEGSNAEDSVVINLIKGGGGAMLREKIVAQASKKNITIVDESKLSNKLGSKSPVPVEVDKKNLESEKSFLEMIGAEVLVRKNSNDENYITDNGNIILDAKFSGIENVEELNKKFNSRTEILGHGLFVGISDEVICAGKKGIEIFTKKF